MLRSFLLPMAALASASVLACADHANLTDPARDAMPPFAGEVTRFEQPVVFFFGLGAGDESVAALFGVGLEEFPAVCAGAAPQELADWMVVTHPTQQRGTSAHVQIKAKELSALVWPVDIGPGGDICDLPTQPFVGSVHFTFNDNEGEFFETAPGANAFSQRFVGTVTDLETGQRYHLQGAIHLVILPDGTVKELPVPFLRLTPIGG